MQCNKCGNRLELESVDKQPDEMIVEGYECRHCGAHATYFDSPHYESHWTGLAKWGGM